MDSNQNTPNSEQPVSDIKTVIDDLKKLELISKIEKVLDNFKKLDVSPKHWKEYQHYKEQLEENNQKPLQTILSVLKEILHKQSIPDENIFFLCIKKIADHTHNSSIILKLYQLAYDKNIINAYVINATIHALSQNQRFHQNKDHKDEILKILNQAKQLNQDEKRDRNKKAQRCIDETIYGCVIDAIGNVLDNDEIMALYNEAKSRKLYNNSTSKNALKAIINNLKKPENTLETITNNSTSHLTEQSFISNLLRDLNKFWKDDTTWRENKIRSMKTCTVAIKAASYLSNTEQQQIMLTWFNRAKAIPNIQFKYPYEIYSLIFIALGNGPNHKNQDTIITSLNEAKKEKFYNTLLFNKAIRALGNAIPYKEQLNTIYDLYKEEYKRYHSLNEITCTIVIVALGNCVLSKNRNKEILEVFDIAKKEAEKKLTHCDAMLYSSLITALGKDPTYDKKNLLALFQEMKQYEYYNTITFNSVLGAMANGSYYPDKENDILNFFDNNKNDPCHPFDVITYHSLFKALQSCIDNETLDIHQNVISIFQEAIEKKCYNESTFGLAIKLVANHPAYPKQEENIQLIFEEAGNKNHYNSFTYNSMISYLSTLFRKQPQDKSKISEQLTQLLKKMEPQEKEFDLTFYNYIITVLGDFRRDDDIFKYLEKAIQVGHESSSLYNKVMLSLKTNHEKAIDLFEKIRKKNTSNGKKYYDDITFHIAFNMLYRHQHAIQNDLTQLNQKRKEKLDQLEKQQKVWYNQALQEKLFPIPFKLSRHNPCETPDQINLHGFTFGSTFFYLENIIKQHQNYDLDLIIICGKELHSKNASLMIDEDHGVRNAIDKICTKYKHTILYTEDPKNLGRGFLKFKSFMMRQKFDPSSSKQKPNEPAKIKKTHEQQPHEQQSDPKFKSFAGLFNTQPQENPSTSQKVNINLNSNLLNSNLFSGLRYKKNRVPPPLLTRR